jgi:acyl-CoA synthetase (AMP-forming)/AMP-acid ligase II
MKGYWSLPEATADAVVSEWFSTGNIGRVDEEATSTSLPARRFDLRTSPLRAPDLQILADVVSRDIGRGSTLLPGT